MAAQKLSIVLLLCIFFLPGLILSDDAIPEGENHVKVQFNFDATPWREVIKWVAENGELALHIGDYPTGSFTYRDDSNFSSQEAIDRINLFLLPQGFTLVRSGKLLSVINFADPRGTQQLNALAKSASVDELNQLQDFELAKCIFPLGELEAEDAVDELSALSLMTAPAVFPKTNQILVIDVAGKLKIIHQILSSFRPTALDNGTVVKSFELKYVHADDVLVVARPHLGLATGEMIGIDVSLSADPKGKSIFVTGIEDKVKLVESLISAIDVAQNSQSSLTGEAELLSHPVAAGNTEMVFDVLQTLLAGLDIRLSADEEAAAIIALAPPEIQLKIADTIKQLEVADSDFEVIPLNSMDPYLVVSLLEQMLGLPDPFLDDPVDIDPNAPRIDADVANQRLFVRGRRHDIEEIKKIVSELDPTEMEADRSGNQETTRLLSSIRGKQGEQFLKSVAKFWTAKNPIFLYVNPEVDSGKNERVVGEDQSLHPLEIPSNQIQLLTTQDTSLLPAIRCQMTPRGLMIQSDDVDALNQLERLLSFQQSNNTSQLSKPVVFYLRYTRAEDAVRTLAELLDGGMSASLSGNLVNGYVSSSGSGLMGSIVTNDGTLTLTSGSVTIIADSRLNRLMVQGTEGEIDEIDEYLKIIDRDSSITSVQTHGSSHVIELVHSKANEVAESIRQAYAGRVVATEKPKVPSNSQSKNTKEQPQEKSSEKKPNENKKTEVKTPVPRNLEPKMTIAVHEGSNSLIITAPDQLFREVEQLALTIDRRSQQAVEVIQLPEGFSAGSIQQILSSGPNVKTSSTSSKSKRD